MRILYFIGFCTLFSMDAVYNCNMYYLYVDIVIDNDVVKKVNKFGEKMFVPKTRI